MEGLSDVILTAMVQLMIGRRVLLCFVLFCFAAALGDDRKTKEGVLE